MTLKIMAVEVRDELYAIIREPAAVFFAIAMPVGFRPVRVAVRRPGSRI